MRIYSKRQTKILKKEKKRTIHLIIRLTTGLFQWKKDYNLGAMHFEEAAK